MPIVFVDEHQRLVYKDMYANLTKRLVNLGHLTTITLAKLEWGRNDWEPAQIRMLYDKWLDTFIQDSPTLNELKRYEDDLKINMNAAIFCELSRLQLILHFDELNFGTSALVGGIDDQTGLTGYSLTQTKSSLWTTMSLPQNLEWDKRVFAYTQSEVMSAILFLTQILDDLASPQLEYGDGTHEFFEYFQALYLRNAIFYCQQSFPPDLLDVEEMTEKEKEGGLRVNFDYYIWCSFYFGAILRRIYYYEQLKHNVLEPPIRVGGAEMKRCQKYVRHLCDILGVESCEEIYTDTCEQIYRLPGDAEWFSHRYRAQPATAIILNKLRPTVETRFWQEANISVESVLSLSKQQAPQFMIRAAAAFVLNVIDAHLKGTEGIAWRDAATVAQTEIELSQWKLSRSSCPLIFQVFSRWWVYDNLHYQPTDSIYEALVMWARLLKTRYKCKLFDVSLKEMCDQILLL